MISRGLMTARVNYSRSLQLLFAPAGTLAASQTAMPYLAVRDFAKKSKKRSRNKGDFSDFEDDPTEVEASSEEVVQEVQPDPEPIVESKEAPTFEPVARDLFSPFSVGDIKQVQSVEGNEAFSNEDTIEGRYAGVLFTTAS